MLALLMPAMAVQRRPDAEKELKCVSKISSEVTIEPLRTIIDCELGTKSNIKTVAM